MDSTDVNKEFSAVTCTWDTNSDCDNCNLNNFLNCKWKKEHLAYFMRIAFYVMIPSGLGLILAGFYLNNWFYLITYVAFCLLWFGIFEIRVLCAHCPYYVEEKQGKVLHCLANQGSLKVWKYHPEPMKLWEQIAFIVGALIFVLFPIYPELLLEMQADSQLLILVFSLILVVTLLAGINFFYKLKRNICPYCVNFSCPFNTVDKKTVDAYLAKNQVMREAWEQSGYKLN